MFRKIVVAVDLGQMDKGRRIIARAKALLDKDGAIVLLNVVEDVQAFLAANLPVDLVEQNRQHAFDQLTLLKEEAGVPAAIEIRTGTAAMNILATAEAHDADLIIIASHRPDLSNYFFGSTADRVVRHAHISVLVDR